MGERESLMAGRAAAAAAVGGLLLLLSLFLPWAQIVCVMEPCPIPSGWEVMGYLDVALALLALASIGLGVVVALFQPRPPLALALAIAGGVAIVLVLLAPLVEDPSVRPVDYGSFWFLALLGALATVVGGLAAFLVVRPSGDDGEEQEGGEEA